MPGLHSFFRLLAAGLIPTIGAHAAATARSAGETQLPPRSTSDGGQVITSELSQYIADMLTSAEIPGISLGVVQTSSDTSNPAIELQSWGRKTDNGDGNDLTPDTLFEIASCSKSFLASAVGILMDDFAQGRNVTPLPEGVTTFDFETKLADLFPGEWVLEDEWTTKKANIRDALSHVTGMPRHDFSFGPGDTPFEILTNQRNLRPAYELREQWSYSNQMYMIGSYLVSKYANTSYMDFATERIFKPTNMSTTTFWPDEVRANGSLTQTWTKFGRRIPSGWPDDVVPLMAGPGGIITSATDLTKWLAVLLEQGVNPTSNETIIPSSAYEEITTAHFIMEGQAPYPYMSIWGYGLGLIRFSYQGYELLAHTGDIAGITTLVVFLPADGLGISVLVNADAKDAAAMAIALTIIDNVLDLPKIDYNVTVDATGTAVLEEQAAQGEQLAAQSTNSSSLPADLEAFSGNYTNAGYGNITLCTAQTASPYCDDVLTSFAPFIAQSPPPELYAAWSRVFADHIRLTYMSDAEFNLQTTSLFPNGYGANTTAFETAVSGESDGTVTFVLSNSSSADADAEVLGFGLVMDTDAVAARQRAGAQDVREWADAWFDKV